ncbi:hypothetical protein WOLCODRAFT_151625 [Wolfiporia cocos MD-104 SS10]|uniref:Uncharacterized protein n=1 Tax=Wolfiporia cocos (strain MD-104) TaxID=742152 RepID=A0A2H3JHB1_WOLCO|nr:hypothetical protein WOLCODRAFT_151625 [Wolfiporia cocos MD-104 SS10]
MPCLRFTVQKTDESGVANEYAHHLTVTRRDARREQPSSPAIGAARRGVDGTYAPSWVLGAFPRSPTLGNLAKQASQIVIPRAQHRAQGSLRREKRPGRFITAAKCKASATYTDGPSSYGKRRSHAQNRARPRRESVCPHTPRSPPALPAPSATYHVDAVDDVKRRLPLYHDGGGP